MRLLSGNPGMYQHSIQQSTEGESTQQEPEHGEDTIARVKGKNLARPFKTRSIETSLLTAEEQKKVPEIPVFTAWNYTM